MTYDNELRGALFKNDQQRVGKKDPDYRGNVTVNGVEYWLDAWLNVAKSGQKFMALKLRPKDEPKRTHKPDPSPDNGDEFADDVPF